MYTLLVVEDEIFARKGIIKKIQASSLNISSILEAKDGKEGVAIARYTPIDIVLSDVRMPRMDGIEMCKEIRTLFPDCVIIFLSGYSDKEYLRSAISMQALQYIDKPVQTQALIQVLEQAVQYCNEVYYSHRFIREANRKRLACFLLTKPAPNGQLPIQIAEADCNYEYFRDSRTVIFQFLSSADSLNRKKPFHDALAECREILSATFHDSHLPFLLTDYRENTLIVHLLSTPERMISSFSQTFWEHLMTNISKQLATFPHFISIGPIVNAPEEIYQSYNAAAIGLQPLFYAGINTISFNDDIPADSYTLSSENFDAFRQAVLNNDREKCLSILNELSAGYRSHPGTLVSITKENFYRLLSWLIRYIRKQTCTEVLDTETYLWELLHSAATLDELLDIARNYLSLTFHSLKTSPGHSVALQIKHVVIDNYENPSLDIQFISEQLNLSVSYLSLLFKQETGLTINHYMNDYRIWKAKELLTGTQMKIADISDSVGYSNQNYFAKIFKKITGMSPSTYRELNSLKQ